MSKNGKLINIGTSIKHQTDLEKKNRGQRKAIARFDVKMTDPSGNPITHVWLTSDSYQSRALSHYDMAGNFKGTTGTYSKELKENGSQYVHKNQNVGVILTSNPFGTYSYIAPKLYGKGTIERKISFSSKATFNNNNSVTNLVISLPSGTVFRFSNLNDLLIQIEELRNKLERKREQEQKEEEDRIKTHKAIEEATEITHLEQQREATEAGESLHEAKEQQDLEEIYMLDELERVALEQIHQTNASYRTGFEMRVQHIVDESQTITKVSHLYDGIPIVIDGGPGTGKTTTSIQRLKFLVDPYLKEHETCKLTEAQIDHITDPATVNSHWIFISPSQLLAQYLKSALSAEGLAHGTRNVIPFENFLINHTREYHITDSNPGTRPPFKPIKSHNPLYQTTLIKDGKLAVENFQAYVISLLSKQFKSALEINTTGFEWQKCAISIQLYCKEIDKAKSFLDIIKLFYRLQSNEQKNVKKFNEELKKNIDIAANRLLKTISSDLNVMDELNSLFDEWQNINETNDAEEIDLLEDEESSVDILSLEHKIIQHLRTLLKRLSLISYDNSLELSKRQKAFYTIISKFVDNCDLSEIGKLAWFNRNFASLCRGYESGVISQLLKLYKSFRREVLKTKNPIYNHEALKEIVTSSENRLLHPDEQALLLGVINNAMLRISKWAPRQFADMKHPFAKAYKKSVKYVIGVDEASDYSELDYYCIASFAHPDYSSITLCGDIMQGLGNNGIDSWKTLKRWVFPKLQVYTLKRSYRQWPTLLELSRQMYKDDQKKEAPYTSALMKQEHEAEPLAFISTEEEDKIDWLAKRINEVGSRFDELPSIAIFINEHEDVRNFMYMLQDHEDMQRYKIEDCTHGNQGREDSIRIFYLSQVKGMEFEAAFFHNIDHAKFERPELLRRFIYVGISRAVSHLAATFNSNKSEIIKYFKVGKTWRHY